MKKLRIFLPLAALLLAAVLALVGLGCSSGTKDVRPREEPPLRIAANGEIDEAAASSIAIGLRFGSLRSTRDADKLIGEVKWYNSAAFRNLRSGEEEILGDGFYAVNFADDKGYVLLAKNQLTVPIIAIAEKGRFCNETTDSVPNLLPIMGNLPVALSITPREGLPPR